MSPAWPVPGPTTDRSTPCSKKPEVACSVTGAVSSGPPSTMNSSAMAVDATTGVPDRTIAVSPACGKLLGAGGAVVQLAAVYQLPSLPGIHVRMAIRQPRDHSTDARGDRAAMPHRTGAA